MCRLKNTFSPSELLYRVLKNKTFLYSIGNLRPGSNTKCRYVLATDADGELYISPDKNSHSLYGPLSSTYLRGLHRSIVSRNLRHNVDPEDVIKSEIQFYDNFYDLLENSVSLEFNGDSIKNIFIEYGGEEEVALIKVVFNDLSTLSFYSIENLKEFKRKYTVSDLSDYEEDLPF